MRCLNEVLSLRAPSVAEALLVDPLLTERVVDAWFQDGSWIQSLSIRQVVEFLQSATVLEYIIRTFLPDDALSDVSPADLDFTSILAEKYSIIPSAQVETILMIACLESMIAPNLSASVAFQERLQSSIQLRCVQFCKLLVECDIEFDV